MLRSRQTAICEVSEENLQGLHPIHCRRPTGQPPLAIMATRDSVCEQTCTLRLCDKWCTRDSLEPADGHVARLVYETNADAPPKIGRARIYVIALLSALRK
jgi:hypothetical protein